MKYLLCLLLLLPLGLSAQPTPLDPDDTGAAMARLLEARAQAAPDAGPVSLAQLARMIDLGMWESAGYLLRTWSDPTPDLKVLHARFHALHYDYAAAQALLDEVLAQAPTHRLARQAMVRLHIAAWRLPQARRLCLDLLQENARDAASILILAEIELLSKHYPKAQALATQAQEWEPTNPEAWYWLAEVAFWQRRPEAAEQPLRTCLQLDPFHANARFSYGYAIWRRVDATLLPAMAAQWEIALAVNPLHYRTHWHWGNGHTHLTYTDYAQPEDGLVRQALTPADSLVATGDLPAALALSREVATLFPTSVLPQMMAGSIFFMAWDWLPRSARLDSAEAVFRQILRRKPHYGPAHNGLAAVIKQRQVPWLAMFDSLEAVIASTQLTDSANFYRVFPDVAYYPGHRADRMVWHQLYTAVVYFPFLSRQGRQFVIPPLHQDLATAMQNPYFRGATTFDNRQWMDIRGVGSGATGIEYVERGAYLERNVTLHEYVHLFHAHVFTDAELRAVRAHYYRAMAEGYILDYYAASNEFEYLAQTFPAYFIPVKVHPLNHKSLNTRSDLQSRDPGMYAFIDSLVQRHRAYLGGDSLAMAANWAQVYVNLADQARRQGRWDAATALLDTAQQWDSTYLPAFLARATLAEATQDWEVARKWIGRAQAQAPGYAPAQAALASWAVTRFEAGSLSPTEAVTAVAQAYRTALRLETDLAERASLNARFRETYRDFGQWVEAIEVAESYLRQAPLVSTYLRDQRDDAATFAASLRGQLGYLAEARAVFRPLLAQKPQHYALRQQYAAVLAANDRPEEAVAILQESQHILRAAGRPDPDMAAAISLYALAAGDTATAQAARAEVPPHPPAMGDPWLWGQARCAWGETMRADSLLRQLPQPLLPAQAHRYLALRGQVAARRGEIPAAIAAYQAALRANAYDLDTRFRLLELLVSQGQKREVARVAREGTLLPLPPGPSAMRRLQGYLR